VDSNAGSTHRSGQGFAGYQTNTGWRVELTGNVFSEDRDNGTPLSINSTDSKHATVETAGRLAGGVFSVRGWGGTQQYHQTFTTVNALRTAEVFIRDQNVPTDFGGGGGQWLRAWGMHTVLVGAEGRYVKGRSIETPYAQGLPLATIAAGGRDRRWSGFLQDTWQVNERLTLVFGAHGDTWRTTSIQTGFEKSSGAFNPRAAAAYRVNDLVTVRGTVYHGFRAPTLNEMYRNFSAGNTLTRANEALDPERMTGGDLGVLVGNGRASARVTTFWNRLDDAITAITLSSTPTQIIRQRANADRLQSNGLELEGNLRLMDGISVDASTGITSTHYAGNTSLRGNRVPQVPSYNAAAGFRYGRQPWTATAQLRMTGPQFEDDLNVFTLRRATVVDVFAGRTIARSAQRIRRGGKPVRQHLRRRPHTCSDDGPAAHCACRRQTISALIAGRAVKARPTGTPLVAASAAAGFPRHHPGPPPRRPAPNGGYVRGLITWRSMKKSARCEVDSANSGMPTNSCGTPANVCSSDGMFASRSSFRKSALLSGGTVTSASPWKRIVGGKLLM
jgi:outer membrane receptor protein involved in Fe transport